MQAVADLTHRPRCRRDVRRRGGCTSRELLWDSQLRWLGPDKGVMHMAIGAVVSALWDLRSRREGRPLWTVLTALTPDEIVDQVDWTYLRRPRSGPGPRLLEEQAATRAATVELETHGLAAYTPPAPDGSATATSRWPICAVRRWPTDSD
ncbi:MAG: hypothetical protein R2695_13015 [Acidimicrobiales bacterium]